MNLMINISEEDYQFLKERYSHLKIKEHLTDTRDHRCYIAIANGTPIEADKENKAAEREKAINEWLGIHCRKCANNDDRGTDFVNCQAECEVQKDVGVACIHYEECIEESEETE